MTNKALWLVLLFVLSVFGLYQVKYQVLSIKREVTALENTLATERKAMHVLRAEWAYLNRPDRLRRLSEAHLGLEPVTAKQMADAYLLKDMLHPASSQPIVPTSGQADD